MDFSQNPATFGFVEDEMSVLFNCALLIRMHGKYFFIAGFDVENGEQELIRLSLNW